MNVTMAKVLSLSEPYFPTYKLGAIFNKENHYDDCKRNTKCLSRFPAHRRCLIGGGYDWHREPRLR